MDINTLINDIFSSLPERFIQGSDSIEADLGIDLGQSQWTIQVKGNNCTVLNQLLSSCNAVIKTGPLEWAGISAGSQDTVALFLAKKLVVKGDLDVALAVMPLFSDYQGEIQGQRSLGLRHVYRHDCFTAGGGPGDSGLWMTDHAGGPGGGRDCCLHSFDRLIYL